MTLKNIKVCLILGTGATKGCGWHCVIKPHNGIKIEKSSGLPPTDEDFFKIVEIEKDFFPALSLFFEKYREVNSQPLNSLEHVFSLIDSGYKFRSGEWRYELEDAPGSYLEVFKEFLTNKAGFHDCHKYLSFLNNLETEYFRNRKFAKFNLKKPENTPHYFTGHCGTELRTLIYEVYAGLERPGNGQCNIMRCFLDEVRRAKFNVLTFNYDLVVEKCLSSHTDGFSYIGYGGLSGSSPNSVPVVKLHGSLNWVQTGFSQPILQQTEPVEPFYDRDAPFRFRQPAIIPPVFQKNLMAPSTDQLQILINQQWAYAESVLKEATHLVFIGYRFPDTDQHSRDFFERVCGKSDVRKKIFYCGKCKENGPVKLDDDLKGFLGKLGELKDCDIEMGGFEKLVKSPGKIKEFIK